MNISYERIVFLIRISTSKIKNPVSIQELIKIIKISRANFSPIKEILLNQKIATETETYGNTKLLNINIKKLDEFITNSNIYSTISNYIKFKDPLLHQP